MAPASKHAKLAEKILNAALDLGLRAGDRLAEQALAESCNVSRTPVRAALKILEQQGLAKRAPEGGLTLACAPEAGLTRLQPATIPYDGDLTARILRDRSARRLDAAVNVSDLCRRYDAPRSAVQKALDTLLARGVLQKAEGQSWLFARMPGDLGAREDSYDFRLLLEPQAILSDSFRLDIKRATSVRARTEALLARADHSIDESAFQEVDLAFHRLIARSAGNDFVTEALLTHHALRHLSGSATGFGEFRLRQSLEEHLRILDHIEQDQRDLAADLMRVHLRLSRNRRPNIANRGAPALAYSRGT